LSDENVGTQMKRIVHLMLSLSLSLVHSASACQASQAQQSSTRESVPFTTTKNFERDVLLSEKPVLVDFFATWCIPCKKMAPIVHDIALGYSGKIKVFKVDIDNEEGLADYLGISDIPTIKVFSGGESVKTSVGLVDFAQISAILDELLNKAHVSRSPEKTNQSL